MLLLWTKSFTSSSQPFAWCLKNLAWHPKCLPNRAIINISCSIPQQSLFLSYLVITYNTQLPCIILFLITAYVSMSLGFYSPNLSSKNVLDSFFKLIGILLILPGTAPASLFSANFPEYRLGSLPFCSCCSLSAPLTKATLISWFLPEGWDFCLIWTYPLRACIITDVQ